MLLQIMLRLKSCSFGVHNT